MNDRFLLSFSRVGMISQPSSIQCSLLEHVVQFLTFGDDDDDDDVHDETTTSVDDDALWRVRVFCFSVVWFRADVISRCSDWAPTRCAASNSRWSVVVTSSPSRRHVILSLLRSLRSARPPKRSSTRSRRPRSMYDTLLSLSICVSS